MTELCDRAKQALAAGDAGAALHQLEEAIGAGLRAPEVLLLRAIALVRLGRHAEALAAARFLLREHVGYAPALDLVDRIEPLVSAASAQPAAGAADEPGTWRSGGVIDERWEVFGSAQGGMGRVYFVRDRQWDGAELAVKSLLTAHNLDLAQTETVRAMFRRETQVWLDLGAHPHIVSGFYTLELDGALRFFMEYVPGESLASPLERGQPLPLDQAFDLAIQLAAGMEYVHARGVVHRDLKPANCLVMPGDTLRVTDFGLGKSAGDTDGAGGATAPADTSGLSQFGAGTPLYMAPEQWEALRHAGKPADVYAFGIILCELITGRRPFDADPELWRRYSGRVPPLLQKLFDGDPRPDLVLRQMHALAPPLPLAELHAAAPPQLEPLVQRCLAKPTDARPDFSAVRRELTDLYHGTFGHPYRRELPQALGPSEAGENNRAVSYYTMGEQVKAFAILDAWLTDHPTSLYPWMNRHTLAIRHGEREPADVADRFAVEVVRSHPGAIDTDANAGGFSRRLGPFRAGHPAAVMSLALSADGGHVATGGLDRRVRVFAAGTGQLEQAFPEQEDMVTAVAFSGDGAVVIAANGNQVTMWRRGQAHPAGQLVGHKDLITSIAVHAATDIALTGSNDQTARIWQLSSRACLRELKKHRDIVRSVALSPDGAWAATCSFDAAVRLWRVGDGQLAHTLSVPSVVQIAAAFHPVQPIVATGGADGVIRLWNRDGGQLAGTLVAEGAGTSAVAFSPDGRLLASGGADRILRIWDLARGQVVRQLAGHRAAIRSIAFAGDHAIITASDDHTARRWLLGPVEPERWPLLIRRDVAVGDRRQQDDDKQELLARAARGDRSALADMRALRERAQDLRRDDDLLAAEHALAASLGEAEGIRESFVSWNEKTTQPVTVVAFSPTGDCVYSGTADGVDRWPARRGGQASVVAAIPRPIAIAVSRDGARLVTATERTLALWNPHATAPPLWQVEWPWRAGAIHALAISADARIVIAGGWSRTPWKPSWQSQGTLRGWRIDDGREIKISNHGNAVVSVALSPTGELAIGGTDDGQILSWDLARGKRLDSLRHGADGAVTAVAISPSARRAISAGADGALSTWNLGSGSKFAERTTNAHHGRVSAVAIDGDERFALSAGDDGRVKLWSFPGLAPLADLEAHARGAVAGFGPRGRQLISGGDDRIVRVWTLDVQWAAQ